MGKTIRNNFNPWWINVLAWQVATLIFKWILVTHLWRQPLPRWTYWSTLDEHELYMNVMNYCTHYKSSNNREIEISCSKCLKNIKRGIINHNSAWKSQERALIILREIPSEQVNNLCILDIIKTIFIVTNLLINFEFFGNFFKREFFFFGWGGWYMIAQSPPSIWGGKWHFPLSTLENWVWSEKK